MFEVRVVENKELIHSERSTNPTTVYRNILNYLNIHVKGKLNGNRFFGLYTSEYRDTIERLDKGLLEPSALAEGPLILGILELKVS